MKYQAEYNTIWVLTYLSYIHWNSVCNSAVNVYFSLYNIEYYLNSKLEDYISTSNWKTRPDKNVLLDK